MALSAQEILTDPSYKGQIVAFTHVHIGNTGINFGACSPGGPMRCYLARRHSGGAYHQYAAEWLQYILLRPTYVQTVCAGNLQAALRRRLTTYNARGLWWGPALMGSWVVQWLLPGVRRCFPGSSKPYFSIGPAFLG